MKIAILGAGAFGTGLAIALGRAGREITLWGRDAEAMADIERLRENRQHLPGAFLPESVTVSAELPAFDAALLCIPAQKLAGFVSSHAVQLQSRCLIACCKGIDLETMAGPTQTLARLVPTATPAILTGPSFAHDIARGLPTALTLACRDQDSGAALQTALSTEALRLYLSTDTTGAELGGALKNIVAIACGASDGAGLGDSARAALITRGYAEMQRLALDLGAAEETLSGLSGFGDLVLTCTSDGSRNYRHGLAIGRGEAVDASATVEGVATAQAALKLAQSRGIDMPITAVVAAMTEGTMTVVDALSSLMTRPVRKE